MSALHSTRGYGHHIESIGGELFRISWTYDTKIRRIRYPRTMSRITDREGAERFAKKWGRPMPAAAI